MRLARHAAVGGWVPRSSGCLSVLFGRFLVAWLFSFLGWLPGRSLVALPGFSLAVWLPGCLVSPLFGCWVFFRRFVALLVLLFLAVPCSFVFGGLAAFLGCSLVVWLPGCLVASLFGCWVLFRRYDALLVCFWRFGIVWPERRSLASLCSFPSFLIPSFPRLSSFSALMLRALAP